jgi:hypothetical protein
MRIAFGSYRTCALGLLERLTESRFTGRRQWRRRSCGEAQRRLANARCRPRPDSYFGESFQVPAPDLSPLKNNRRADDALQAAVHAVATISSLRLNFEIWPISSCRRAALPTSIRCCLPLNVVRKVRPILAERLLASETNADFEADSVKREPDCSMKLRASSIMFVMLKSNVVLTTVYSPSPTVLTPSSNAVLLSLKGLTSSRGGSRISISVAHYKIVALHRGHGGVRSDFRLVLPLTSE